jgi:hypothetical protein
MRGLVLAAMPANSIAVGQAVAVDQMIEQVWWRRRYHWRWHRWDRWRRW